MRDLKLVAASAVWEIFVGDRNTDSKTCKFIEKSKRNL